MYPEFHFLLSHAPMLRGVRIPRVRAPNHRKAGHSMKAETLKGFFEGGVGASVLAGEAEKTNHDVRDEADDALTDDLPADFVVTGKHLEALCDSVTRGDLQASHLEVIASVLVRSERFMWDPSTAAGALVSRVIYAWEAPEINYVLSRGTVEKFRLLLRTGRDTFDGSDWSELPRACKSSGA
jgi:hypothetical protein